MRRSVLHMLAVFTLLPLSVVYSVEIPGGTPVSGNITTQTWTLANSPYLVTGAITVASGNTLTIEPGVQVLFDVDTEFLVYGNLTANGVEGDSVVFDAGVAPEWEGIDVKGSATLSYTRIGHGNANGADIGGGGMRVSTSAAVVTVSNSRFHDNHSNGMGGAIYFTSRNTPSSLTNCTFENNVSGSAGGAVALGSYAITIYITDCVFRNNHSTSTNYAYGGGAIRLHFATGVITGCLFEGNTSAGYGGALAVVSATSTAAWAVIDRCTFNGNSASWGAAVYASREGTGGVTLNMKNSILWTNAGGNQIHINGAVSTNVTYSDIAGGFGGTGNINLDPLYVGGADYSLQSGSPVIDAGDPGSTPDQDGSTADMGAFQYDQSIVPEIITTTTWKKAVSPYRISQQTTIAAGHTLTIDPGVDVLLDADVQLVVLGRINAVGTETDSIRFLKGTAVEWGGIRISGGDTSSFAYTRISDGDADNASPGTAGGGIGILGPDTRLSMDHSVLSGNSASYGGALYADSATTVTLDYCTFANNSATTDGGGLHIAKGDLVLENCDLFGNSAGDWGGGLRISTSTATIKNCTITSNSASSHGGGFYNDGSNVTVVNSTISDNTTGVAGGAIRQHVATTTIQNTIIWGNSVGQIEVVSGTLTATYSDIQGGYAGTGNIDTDPLFVDVANGDYSLQGGSPCIDTGHPMMYDPDGSRTDMGGIYYVQPGTNIAGAIGTSTWDLAGSPYYITDQCTVKTGEVLTIDPGVEVLAQTDVAMIVQGRMLAIGAEGDSISFSKALAAQWGGLYFEGGDSSTVHYAEITGVLTDAAGGDRPARSEIRSDFAWPRAAKPSYQHFQPSGGAIDVYGAGTRLDLAHSRLHNNVSVVGGGICVQTNAMLWADNCEISGNSAEFSFGIGGGICVVDGGWAWLKNTTIADNSAETAGGGMFTSFASGVYLDNCTVSGNNVVFGDGGGLYLEQNYVSVTGGSVVSNSSDTNNGGGLFINNSTVDFDGSTVSLNSAAQIGGGLYIDANANVTVKNSEVSSNGAVEGAGACVTNTAIATFYRTKIVSNSATVAGGGVYNESGSLNLENITFANNTAIGDSGSALRTHGAGAISTVKNSIFVANSPGSIISTFGGSESFTYTDVHGSLKPGVGNIDAHPNLSGVYAPNPGSPVIDTGDSTTFDPDGTRADMGAVYFAQAGTNISGPIPTSVWDLAGSPYYVTDQCTVKTGEVLTIDPGVEIRAQQDVAIIVEGSLNAIGAVSDSIRFLPFEASQWGGLYFTSGDTSTLHYAEITGVYTSQAAQPRPSQQSTTGRRSDTERLARPAYTTTSYAGGAVVVINTGTRLGLAHANIHGNYGRVGGGISVRDSAHVSASNCKVTLNDANVGGGGVYIGDGASADLTNCEISDNMTASGGGGLFVGLAASVNATDCIISGNAADEYGGGVFVDEGTATLTNCIIDNNSVLYYEGGGILVDSWGDITLTNCTISGNSADQYDGGGCAIRYNSTAVMSGCTITGNYASGNGGGLYVFQSVVTMSDMDINANITDGDGGGIYSYYLTTLNITDCLINSNTSASDGGGMYARHTTLSVIGSDLSLNTATSGNGGGLYVDDSSTDSTTTLTNCTITDNSTALDGGGLYNLNAPATLTNCTISGNDSNTGGGLYNGNLAVTTITNCILWADIATQEVVKGTGIVSATYSDIQGDTTWAGIGNLNTDPMFVDSLSGDYTLQTGSPAIDAGDPTTFDPDGSIADMGGVYFVQAGTNIAGPIGTSVWNLAGSPYYVTAQCTVKTGQLLTIQPGVEVRAQTDVGIVVEGSMYAVGAVGDTIRFLPNLATQWGGLNFFGGDSSTIHFAEITGVRTEFFVRFGGETCGDCAKPAQDGEAKKWTKGGHGAASDVAAKPTNSTSNVTAGGIYLEGPGTGLGLANSIIHGNTAPWGAGIGVFGAAFLSAVDCNISNNVGLDMLGNGSAGAGIGVADLASIELTNCTIENNTADNMGGGLWLSNAEASLTNCVVSSNTVSTTSGGGIYADIGSVLLITGGSINANSVSGGSGGGLYITDSFLDIADGTVTSNQSSGPGGGIYIELSTAIFDNCDISSNQSTVSYGGGIECGDTDLTMIDCTVSNNIAYDDGGGIDLWGAIPATITGSTFEGNDGGDGGAIWLDAPLDIDYSVFNSNVSHVSGHTDGAGGAIYYASGPLTLSNSTIYDNSAIDGIAPPSKAARETSLLGRGGGIGLYSLNPGVQLIAENTIIWSNYPDEIGNDGSTTDTLYIDYCDIMGDTVWAGIGNIKDDPSFSDTRGGDFTLALGSPAVNRGNPDSLDVDGTRRDMGAYPTDLAVAGYSVVNDTVNTQTWSAAGSPYRVNGPISVLSGHTLTITQGVDVLFDADVQFTVDGAIGVVGVENDTVRFVSGVSPEWGGIRFVTNDSSSIAYALIGGGHAQGAYPDKHGGGIFMSPSPMYPRLLMKNSVVAGNQAEGQGGGVFASRGWLRLIDCEIYNNSSLEMAGGVYLGTSTVADIYLERCLIADNTVQSGSWGGGDVASSGDGGTVEFVNCTIADNTSLGTSNGGGTLIWSTVTTGTHSLTNCIVWGNSPDQLNPAGGVTTVAYSDVQGDTVWTDIGNINDDPMFVDSLNGDYSLQVASPAIDTADPASSPDPDRTVTDMGAYPFDQDALQYLVLPTFDALRGATVDVVITGFISAATEVDVSFAFDSNAVSTVNIVSSVFDVDDVSYLDGIVTLGLTGLGSPVIVTDDTVAVLSLTIPQTAPPGARTLAWEGAPISVVDSEAVPTLTNGAITLLNLGPTFSAPADTIAEPEAMLSITVTATDSEGDSLAYGAPALPIGATFDSVSHVLSWVPALAQAGDTLIVLSVSDGYDVAVDSFALSVPDRYGDVTQDGSLSALDASWLLQYSVGLRETIHFKRADVTDNGTATATDAALVLYKVVTPAYLFPVRGGSLPKPARSRPSFVSWQRLEGGWELIATNAGDILGADIEFDTPLESDTRLKVWGEHAIRSYDDHSLIAIARSPNSDESLLRIMGDLDAPPKVSEISLNEGAIEVYVVRPARFELAQNAPNPFNPSTTIRFGVPDAGQVKLVISDVTGRHVRTLVDKQLDYGSHISVWDGLDASGRECGSGVYVYRLTWHQPIEDGGRRGTEIRRMVLVR
jgi:fibronectin-binding autotransporter adhesin